ncbi:MAG TPA: hypothetical protein VIL79_00265, partial [Thermoleophilia bacterium]
MIVLWYILIPAVAAPLAWLLSRAQPLVARWIAVAGTALPLALVTWQWVAKAGALSVVPVFHTSGVAGLGPSRLLESTWIAHVHVPWIAPLGISFFLAEDG